MGFLPVENGMPGARSQEPDWEMQAYVPVGGVGGWGASASWEPLPSEHEPEPVAQAASQRLHSNFGGEALV